MTKNQICYCHPSFSLTDNYESTYLLSNVGDALQLVLHILSGHNFLNGTFHIQPGGVVAGVRLIGHGVDLALDHELIVVQVTIVSGDTEVVPHVLTAQTLLAGHQGLEQLLAVAGADDVGAGVAEELLDSLGQVADGGSIRLLNEQVTGVAVLEGEHNQIHSLVQIHQETSHIRVSDGDGVASLDLVDVQAVLIIEKEPPEGGFFLCPSCKFS